MTTTQPSDSAVTISDARIEEMLVGLEGLPVGPWWTGDHEADLIDGKGRWLDVSHGEPIWEHFARCDPDTMRAILTELAALRSAPAPEWKGMESVPLAWRREPKGAIYPAQVTDFEEIAEVWAEE
jgi:hypothetical protein